MIGILTFYWADDCGAMLQSYALKTYLSQYQETVFIPYFPKPLRSRYRLLRYHELDNIFRRCYKITKQLMPWTFYKNCRLKYNMCRFRKMYLTEERRRLHSARGIYDYTDQIETYVVGSDQVWNPEITAGFQDGYFCTFRSWKKDAARYVAYAASIGSERLDEKYTKTLSGLLQNFDAISLREALAVPYIQQACEQELTVVLDPVFLIKREEWLSLFDTKVQRKRKYIAVYYTEYNDEMAKYLRKMERETGWEVLMLRMGTFHWTEHTKYAIGCGPSEFLELIYHAEYVVTNSFHGTAFSILFQKPFTVFLHSRQGARIRDLLRVACLEDHLTDTADDITIDAKIDWERTEKALQKTIRHSKEFIEKEILFDGHGTGSVILGKS